MKTLHTLHPFHLQILKQFYSELILLHFLKIWLLDQTSNSCFHPSVTQPMPLQIFANQLESTPCDLTHEEAPMKRSGQTLLGHGGGSLYVLLNLAHSLGHCGSFGPLDGASGSPFGPAHWQFSHNMWCHDDANLKIGKLTNWKLIFLIRQKNNVSLGQVLFVLTQAWCHFLQFLCPLP